MFDFDGKLKNILLYFAGRRNYHYLMSGLVLDDKWDSTVEEFGAINMTGLRIVQYGTNLARDFFRGFQPQSNQQQGGPWSRSTSEDALNSATISSNAALAFDTVNLLINTFGSLMRKNVNLFTTNRRKAKFKEVEEGVGCGDLSGSEGPNTWEHGQRILQEIKNTSFEGLTGLCDQYLPLTFGQGCIKFLCSKRAKIRKNDKNSQVL